MSKNDFELGFLGIGAEKAGTTWIADCLREHPEVNLPDSKEIFFFNDFDPHFLSIKNYRYKRGLSWYARQFNGVNNKLNGEISPTYLYSKVAAKRIRKNFPDVKIMVVLRDPKRRALSQYIHDKRLGVIKDIIFYEAIRMYSNYIEKGLYFKHLKNYFDLFNNNQVLVLFHEDLKNKPKDSLKKVYKFLKLKDTRFKPKALSEKSNVAGKAKLPAINYFMMQADYFLRTNELEFILKLLDSLGVREFAKKLRDLNSTELGRYPDLDSEAKKFLNSAFKEDIEKLEEMLGKNLSEWK